MPSSQFRGRRLYFAHTGQRVKSSVNASNATYFFFPSCEREVVAGVSSDVNYYFFGGQRIAVRINGGAFVYLYGDHLNSTVTTTSGTTPTQERYQAYGANRSGSITATEYKYTGQRSDTTGLIYMNARYYDPALGQFISPDTIVPDPDNLFDYNRYLYVRGNPLKYSDPSGHNPMSILDRDPYGGGGGGGFALPAGAIGATFVGGVLVSVAYQSLDADIAPLQEAFPLGPARLAQVDGIPLDSDPTDVAAVTRPVGIDGFSEAFPLSQEASLEDSIYYASYRDVFFRKNPGLIGEVVVHHRIEQQVLQRYPGLFTREEIGSLQNLVGIPIDQNAEMHLSRIRVAWNQFYREHPNADRSAVEQFASTLDVEFKEVFKGNE